MATKKIAGIFRSDTTLGNTDLTAAGNSFSSDLMTRIDVELGADDTIFDGDNIFNEVPNDPTQTYDDGSGAGAFAYDYTVEVSGSDGNTYQLIVFDYDINNDGDFGDGNVGGEDFGENNFFMAFTGALPPPGITLTTTGIVTDNSPNIFADNIIICFASGTLIQTPTGVTPIDALKVGALVLTEDCVAQPIRWIGSKTLDPIDLELHPQLKPILIRADALGPGYPRQDLIVSPQHRILVRSAIARRIFGVDEVLVSANKLTEIDGVGIKHDNPDGIVYFHLLFDTHQIICANGAKTESLFTGPEALRAISPAARKELKMLFPEICKPDFQTDAARLIPEKGRMIRKLVQRHQQNRKSLYVE